ncbi:MAG: 4-demethylwyosine synthase TYW1 [Candidatus Methanomethylicota archaeon]|uniref:S-adenosyl-L-methionine-dependent tRNA 4-demethylwyosine synthase n=1 Tax=Thermoproteota archaeon TaxID=2056631 RepID=A0A497EWF8_9CREN|nr:MAG: 4-demethylwyosine synthase TYW1 [Candidatus Verstraetearchaeota archaeon]
MAIPKQIIDVYKRQGYHFVGKTSVVKPCHWLKASLLTKGEKFCYKQKFYGIPSHRCLQMSPTLACTQQCLYCWRVQASDLNLSWDEMSLMDYDEPEEIVVKAILKQRQILSGLKSNKLVDRKMLEEAFRPIHAAISLVGEPTLYPKIGELIGSFFSHGFKTVFLVTNGTNPKVLSNLEYEPSQLYVSLSAPDEETYRKVCRPRIKDGWERLNETLELLKSFSCPTVIRVTLVKQLNMHSPEKYAKLICKAEPTYVEPKAAMSLGWFRYRLPLDAMPRFEEVKEFGEQLSRYTGYKMIDFSVNSRIILLSKLDKPIKLV